MKAISINASLETGSKTLAASNKTAREVVLMNIISNIMIKDKDIKKSTVENKFNSSIEDRGFNLYRALEFSKDKSIKANHNLQMEIICSRLV